ncbi:hypothetical protein CVIRNUC_004953 [Coccomyxa viridis]|uniref:CAAX prenyl protease n=1 Tax=Coccomyxa viridis TaxID=1274662 RepID=A0AAV1I6V1_9CHLO|nr:hypothetical protein CVIRNUC_004953 [Coccomyxa viridis]
MTVLGGSILSDDVPWLKLVVAFSILVYTLHTYLDIRQLKAIRRTKPPAVLADSYPLSEYRKTQAYNVDKWWFSTVAGAIQQVLEVVLLINLYLPWLWDRADAVTWFLARHIGWFHHNEIWVSVMFNLLDGAKDLVLGLPFGLYGTFVVEQKHGFNKQTLGLFLMDQLKSVGIGLVMMPPVIAAFTWILQHTGPMVPLYLWSFIFGLQIFFMTIYPIAIAPLFNKFSPLEKGTLKDQIEELAGSLQFPLKKLFVIDGSTRSAHSNAYMYGFFKNKRIVLYDTLIEQCREPEVVAVLAHELGHWKMGHTVKNLVVTQIQTLMTFLLFSLVRSSRGLFTSFGFVQKQPAIIAYTLFSIISAPLSEVLGLLSNIMSRRYEFQADNFAASLGHSEELKQALKKLDAKNRSAVNVDAWYSAYHHSHPPLVERLAAIDDMSKKAE